MEIWLKGSEKIRVPVLPSGYQVSSAQMDETVTVTGLGEILLKGKRGLVQVSFSSFFPAVYDPGYCEYSGIKSPMQYVDMIEGMKRSGTVKLVMTGISASMRCRIQSFEWGEEDGTGDISYTLAMKEYRNVHAGVSSVVTLDSIQGKPEEAGGTVSATASRTSDERTGPTTYTVQKGDTLSAIARKLTGSASWKALYEQNRGIIGSNPNMIQVGMVLAVPG